MTIPYFVPTWAPPTQILFFSKLTFTLDNSVFSVPIVNDYFTPGGFEFEGDRAYFMVAASTIRNFQSYYLTVDRCITRDSENICQECLSGYYRITQNPGNLCKGTSEFPKKYGIVVGATTLAERCESQGCNRCLLNNKICTECSTKDAFFLMAGLCYRSSNLPRGFGIFAAYGTIVECSKPHCENCSANYQTCTECDQANGYILVNGLCSQVNPLTLDHTTFKASSRDYRALVYFSEEILPIDGSSLKYLNISIEDLEEGRTFDCTEITCQFAENFKNGFSIRFESPVDITRGRMRIYPFVDTTVTAPRNISFLDFPVLVEDVHFEINRAARSFGRQTLMVLRLSQGITPILASFTNPSAAGFLDALMCKLIYLEVLEGPFIFYPEILLSATVNLDSLPIYLVNPFKNWVDQDPCNPSDGFKRNGIECNILGSNGFDFIQLGFTLAISLSVILVTKILIDKKQKAKNEGVKNDVDYKPSDLKTRIPDPEVSSLKHPQSEQDLVQREKQLEKPKTKTEATDKCEPCLLKKIRKVFGLQVFLAKLHGLQLEMILYSFMSIRFIEWG